MKTLKDVVIAVQHELDCSISELSRKLGKSRNYLFTHLKNGLSAEKEQEIIKLLLELVDDENRMLRNVVSDQEETITAYRDKVEIKNKTISNLHQSLNSIEGKHNKKTKSQNSTIVELNNTIATKDLFIDGQDKEIEKLNKSLNSYRSLSDAQAGVIEKLKADHEKNCNDLLNSIRILSTDIESKDIEIDSMDKSFSYFGNLLHKEKKKTRTLSLGIIAIAIVSTIALWWLS